MQSKLILFLFSLIFTTSAYCQIENFKWQKADVSYDKIIHNQERNYSFEAVNAGEFIINSFANAYWFFISDVDGDNCPFRPSCSEFFLESLEQTNIFQASLMFFDRFTRDLNIAKGYNHYPRVSGGYYYDPPQNYTLNQGRIKYLPPAFIVDNE